MRSSRRACRRKGTTAVVDLSEAARTNGGGSAFESVETLWGSVITSEPLTRAPAAGVLGPVWLDVARARHVSATADVPPGDYELWAYESSAKDGSVTWLDTKRITVNN
ncbi:MAG: hypothetical protein ACR2K2_16245 [Mycobacteriales bacterium]